MERGKQSKENRGRQLQFSFAPLEHFPKSIFYMLIPFQSSGSQESNASNHVRFGAEMRKIWPSQDNCIQLKDKFASCEFGIPTCESDFATCELGAQCAKMDSKLRNQLVKFSQVTMQRAKLGYLCTDSFRSFLQIFLYKFPFFFL